MDKEIVLYILGYLMVSGICSLPIISDDEGFSKDITIRSWQKVGYWLIGLPVFAVVIIYIICYGLYILFVRPVIILIKKLKDKRTKNI